MNPYLAILIVVANAAIFTHFDAARLRDSHHIGIGPSAIAPHAWAALVFLFLPVALPYYLAAARGPAKQAAFRDGPPPQFTARDLNVWGYVASVVFFGLAILFAVIGRFPLSALSGLCVIVGLFGGRKAVQVDSEGRAFDLGGAAWDMSGFRPVDEAEGDDDAAVLAVSAGSVAAALADRVGSTGSGVAGSGTGDLGVFSPPPRTEPARAPSTPAFAPGRRMTADAAPPAALAASSTEDDDEDVWDPVRADEEAQRAAGALQAPAAQSPSVDLPSSAATQPLPVQPVMSSNTNPPDDTTPAQSSFPAASDSPTPAPPAQTPAPVTPPIPPPPPPAPAPTPAMDLGEELPAGLVDDDDVIVGVVDDDLAAFELAPDEDDEEEIVGVSPDDDDLDEDLDRLVPLPPLANLGTPRPAAPRAPASSASRPPASAAPRPGAPASRPGGPSPGAPARPTGPPATPRRGDFAPRPAPRPRPSGPPAGGGFAGKASSSGPPVALIWVVVIAAILGAGWWFGTQNKSAVDEMPADAAPADSAADSAEPASGPALDRAAAAEDAMRRQMNTWIATYDAVMRPLADLVEEIDFDTLGRGSCLELQKQAEKANSDLRVAPDDEVELLLRPAFESFVEAGRACSAKNEVDWSVHLLQAKDHTHETQLLLDERYRYVGPFELEQEEALGHERSVDTISGRYLAGQLDSQE